MIVMAISDMHYPFQHKDSLKFLKAVKRKYKPNVIVNSGDLEDYHGINMHDHDPDGASPGHELINLINELQPFMKEFPKMYMCTSNHGSLPLRRGKKFGIPKAMMKNQLEIIEAPKGWQLADSWEFDGVIYEHGDPFSGASGALKCAEQNMQSTVIGHIHSFAGIQYSANSKHLIFGFNVGCLIDREKYAFEYAKKIKRKPILGVGIIDSGVPLFVPMTLVKGGHWVGKL